MADTVVEEHSCTHPCPRPPNIRDRHRPLSSSEPRDRPSAELGSYKTYRFPRKHEFPNTLMQDGTFDKFIIVTIIVPLEHDPVGRTLRRPLCLKIYAPL